MDREKVKKLTILAGLALGLLIALPPGLSVLKRMAGWEEETAAAPVVDAAPAGASARKAAPSPDPAAPSPNPASYKELKDLMEAVGDEYRLFKKSSGLGDFREAAERARLLPELLALAPGHEPPIRKERMDDFRAFAEAAREKARALAEAVSAPGVSAQSIQIPHKELMEACQRCHAVFDPESQ